MSIPTWSFACTPLGCIASVLLVWLPLTAQAQTPAAPTPAHLLREGQPEVLVPVKKEAPSAFDLGRFKAAYAAAGSPKVVLFWNRELTDQLVADRVELTRDSHWEQDTRSRQQSERNSEHVTEKRSVVETSGGREGPQESRDWRVRSAYVGTLLRSGVQLLDRNLILRSQGLRDKTHVDAQQVETAALQAGAAWLLEVVLTPAAATDGWVLHSRLKRVSDGQVLADSLYDAAAAAQSGALAPPRLVADPVKGGYVALPAITAPGAADQRLGSGAAQSLLTHWAQAPGMASN